MIKRVLYAIERFIYGRIELQPLFESLHRTSVRGMNYMQSQSVFHTGEIFALKFAKKCQIKEQTTILFDVGANEGQFLQLLYKEFSSESLIYSFQPSSKAFGKLIANMDYKNVSFFNLGFGDTGKRVSLFNSGNLMGTIYPMAQQDQDFEEVTLMTIDDFCYQNAIEEIFYLKIDVEGAELDVLRGSKRMLIENRIQFIQFEYGPNSMAARVFLKDFFEILENFKILRILKNGLRPIKSYNEILEIPLTCNFLAQSKNI